MCQWDKQTANRLKFLHLKPFERPLIDIWSTVLLCLKQAPINKPGSIVGDYEFKGELSWCFFISFVKNDEIRPSTSCQIILEWQEKRNQLNSWKEQFVICSSAFWKQKCETLKNISPNLFQVWIHTDPLFLWPEALIDSFIVLGW